MKLTWVWGGGSLNTGNAVLALNPTFTKVDSGFLTVETFEMLEDFSVETREKLDAVSGTCVFIGVGDFAVRLSVATFEVLLKSFFPGVDGG